MPVVRNICILFIFLLLVSCSSSQSPREAAVELAQMCHSQKFNELWKRVASESRENLQVRLNQARKIPEMRKWIRDDLGIPENEIDSLSPEKYLIASLASDKAAIDMKTEILIVEQDGDNAKYTWSMGDGARKGVSRLKKENGKWMMVIDYYK